MAKHVTQQSKTQIGRSTYHSVLQTRRGRKKFWSIVLVVSSLVFVAAVVTLVLLLLSYWQGRNLYSSVAETAFDTPISDTISLVESDDSEVTLASVSIDWDALLAINSDLVGWIYIPDTIVNYPIVQGTDNSYYLRRNFEGNSASYGSIFLAAENTSDFSDTNNVLFGHRMNDGSMFGALSNFQDSSVFNQNRTVYLFTPTANYRFTTFAALLVDSDDPLLQTNFDSDEELLSYVEDKLDRSVVSADPAYTASEVLESGKILTLITCNYFDRTQRVVLFAYASEVELLDDADASTSDSTDSSGITIDPDDAAAVESASEEAA